MQRRDEYKLKVGDIKDIVKTYNDNRVMRTAVRKIRNGVNYRADTMELLSRLSDQLPADRALLLNAEQIYHVTKILLDTNPEKGSQTEVAINALKEKFERAGAKLESYRKLFDEKQQNVSALVVNTLYQCYTYERGEKVVDALRVMRKRYLVDDEYASPVDYISMLAKPGVPEQVLHLDKKSVLNSETLNALPKILESKQGKDNLAKFPTTAEMLYKIYEDQKEYPLNRYHELYRLDNHDYISDERFGMESLVSQPYLFDAYDRLHKANLLNKQTVIAVSGMTEDVATKLISAACTLKEMFSEVVFDKKEDIGSAFVVEMLINDIFIQRQYKRDLFKAAQFYVNVHRLQQLQKKNTLDNEDLLSALAMLVFCDDNLFLSFEHFDQDLITKAQLRESNRACLEKAINVLVCDESRYDLWIAVPNETFIRQYRINRVLQKIFRSSYYNDNESRMHMHNYQRMGSHYLEKIQFNLNDVEKSVNIFYQLKTVFWESYADKHTDNAFSAGNHLVGLFVNFYHIIKTDDFLRLVKHMMEQRVFYNEFVKKIFALPYVEAAVSALRSYYEKGLEGFKSSELVREYLQSSQSSVDESFKNNLKVLELLHMRGYKADAFLIVIDVLSKCSEHHIVMARRAAQVSLMSRLEQDRDKGVLATLFKYNQIFKYLEPAIPADQVVSKEESKSQGVQKQRAKEAAYVVEIRRQVVESRYGYLFSKPSDTAFTRLESKSTSTEQELFQQVTNEINKFLILIQANSADQKADGLESRLKGKLEYLIAAVNRIGKDIFSYEKFVNKIRKIHVNVIMKEIVDARRAVLFSAEDKDNKQIQRYDSYIKELREQILQPIAQLEASVNVDTQAVLLVKPGR